MTEPQINPTMDIANQLAALCREGKNLEAVNTLYADDIVSVEVMDCPEMGMPRMMEGIDAIRGKNKWWLENHEVHSNEVLGPFPHGNRFILIFKCDCTPQCEGPTKGQRMQMREAGLYTLNDAGKIAKEEFFYHM